MSRSAAYSAHQPDHHSQYTPTTTSRSCSLSESDYDDDPAVKPNLFCSPCKRPANQRSTPNRTARCDLLCSFSRSVDLLIRMTMGVAEMEVAEHTAAASVEPVAARPARERMFQVVPVPGEFTRGRWKCWDYRERVVEGSNGQATAPATSEPRWGMLLQFDEPDEKENMDTLSDTLTSTSMTCTSTMPIGEGMGGVSGGGGGGGGAGGQQTGGGGGSHGSVPVLHTVTVQSETVPDGGQREQSSTILVTSIAPAPPTPLHGTPQSGVEERIAAGVAAAAGGAVMPVSPLSTSPDVGSGSLAAGMAKNADYNDAMLSPTAALREAAGGGSVTNVAREEMEIPQPPTQQELNGLSCASPIGGRPDDLQMTCSSSLPLGASASTLGAGLTTPLNPHPLGAPRTASTEQASTPVEEDPSSSAVSAIGGANVVAIDNKIEQAMDLVKTHLTFAVREEVEILRSTIVDLEARVAGLEQQNQYLRQFVPAEVLANLAIISRQPTAGTPTHATPSIAPLPAPKTVPSGTFCPATATLASTLNTVVAEGKSPKMNH